MAAVFVIKMYLFTSIVDGATHCSPTESPGVIEFVRAQHSVSVNLGVSTKIKRAQTKKAEKPNPQKH